VEEESTPIPEPEIAEDSEEKKEQPPADSGSPVSVADSTATEERTEEPVEDDLESLAWVEPESDEIEEENPAEEELESLGWVAPNSTVEATAVNSEGEELNGDASTRVEKSVIALSVENREPKGIIDQVSVAQGRVYCWIHVINGQGKKVVVRWITNGKELWETSLSIRSDNFRTWAYMTLRPGLAGPARVEIIGEEGQILKTESFEITG
jgi:hypothetical protein